MSTEQLVVVALMVAAFAAGWIARDPPARGRRAAEDDEEQHDMAGAPPAAPAPAPVAPAPASAPISAGGTVEQVAGALAGAIDAWLDGAAPGEPLARFDAAIEALDGHQDPALADARAAAHQAADVLDRFRDCLPLDAASSRALEASEDRLDAALDSARGGRLT